MKKIYNYLYLFILLYQPPIAKYNILHFLAIIAWFHIIKEERNYLKKELIIDILFFLSINTYLIIIILLNNNNYSNHLMVDE